MSNPFDDLESDDSGGGSDESGSTETDLEETSTRSDPEPRATAEPVSDTQTSPPTQTPPAGEADRTPAKSAEPVDLGDAGPGFEYKEVKQRPIYARSKTWDEFEDEVAISLLPELRKNEVRNEETREIHDAMMKVAIEHMDEVADQLLETRRENHRR